MDTLVSDLKVHCKHKTHKCKNNGKKDRFRKRTSCINKRDDITRQFIS